MESRPLMAKVCQSKKKEGNKMVCGQWRVEGLFKKLQNKKPTNSFTGLNVCLTTGKEKLIIVKKR